MQRGCPTVAVDPELHRVVRSFDIDIDGYTRYLYGQGLNPGQVKGIKICFTATGRFLSAGVYNVQKHKIQISVPRARNVNQLLVHETHHAVEGMLGQISNIDRAANYIFNVGVYAGFAVLVLAAAWSLLSEVLHISQLNNVLHFVIGFGVALFLIGGIAYVVNPAERRACAVQAPSTPFVKVVKRSFRRQLIGLGEILVARAPGRSQRLPD